MNKLIILLYLLITTFTFSSLSSNEADFSVRMNLIEPLSLTVNKHMNFGHIAKGSTKEAEAIFIVKGEIGKKYSVVVNDGSNNSKLTHISESSSNIPVEISLDSSSTGILETSETEFKIIGKATYAKENSLQPGEYRGTIVVRVNYN